jgi:hypothetical protein
LFENFPRISKLKPSLEQAHQENFARPYVDVATAFVVGLKTVQRLHRDCRSLKCLQKVEVSQCEKKTDALFGLRSGIVEWK